MTKTEILVISSDEMILQNSIAFLNTQPGFMATGATLGETAIEKFQHQHFDVVLLSNDISEMEERKLHKLFTFQNAGLVFLNQKEAGNATIVKNITTALDMRREENRPVFSITDDALKNAGLNILIQ